MTTPKKKVAKKKFAKKRPVAAGKDILYLHVDRGTKLWLKTLAKKQAGHVSQSTMAERIFVTVKKNPKLIQAA